MTLNLLDGLQEEVSKVARGDAFMFWGGPINDKGAPPSVVRRRVVAMLTRSGNVGLYVLGEAVWPSPTARDLALMSVCAGGNLSLPGGWERLAEAELIEAEKRAMRRYVPQAPTPILKR